VDYGADGADGAITKDHIVSGQYCSPSNTGLRPWNQVKKNTSWYGKFIYGRAYWNPLSTLSDVDVLWQGRRDSRNDPCSHYKADSTYVEFWHEGNAGQDPGSGVCQDVGTAWKIPSPEEWGSIYRGGTVAGNSNAATANTWVWDNGGRTTSGANYTFTRPGGYQIRPDNQTTTLFLPAIGHRYNVDNAPLRGQGTAAYYWGATSVTGGDNAYNLYFAENCVSPALNHNRALGFAVRCIKGI
jgi:uncharacterized protein (TIGR02145 family)